MKEYGFETMTKEEGLSFVDISMKVKSIDCVNSYRQKTGIQEIGKDFFEYLNLFSAYNKSAYFVKEVRQKFKDNNCSSVEDLPELAITQLVALEMILITISEVDPQPIPLKPTSNKAILEIENYVEVAKDIERESIRVREYEEVRSREALEVSQRRQQNMREKISALPIGALTNEKLKVLQSLTQEDIVELMYDSEDEFDDVEALVWIFSQVDCEITTVTAFIEMWSVAEPCLSVTAQEDHTYLRSNFFPIYSVIAKGLNSLRYVNQKLGFTKGSYAILENVVEEQRLLETERKTLLYEVNPQILFHYKELVN